MKTRLTLGATLGAVAWLAGAVTARATVDMQKKAKAAGFQAANCLYCHGEKMPKQGASSYNERGKWLQAEKEKRKAKEVDVSWLKDYVEPAK